jgi:hypothetical protein
MQRNALVLTSTCFSKSSPYVALEEEDSAMNPGQILLLSTSQEAEAGMLLYFICVSLSSEKQALDLMSWLPSYERLWMHVFLALPI